LLTLAEERLMRSRRNPLLCELHAHTTWSDGELSLREVVDLYGRSGFDLLCVTDHVVRSDDPWRASRDDGRSVTQAIYDGYLAAIEREAARARSAYDLLVVPGLELTFDDEDPARGAHAVAVGLRSFVGLDEGLDAALARARREGAALIAAHPYAPAVAADAPRTTARWALDVELASAVDRFELFNRADCFHWVAAAGLPAVASGDFHRIEHLRTWKTLVPAAKDEEAVVSYLRSERPAYLVNLAAPERLRPAA
jgi:predicted metal-dependent phosphoesterase TrpH